MQYLRSKLTKALIAHFGDDDRRIDHALNVTKWAERILEAEGGDEAVILSAGMLHDCGIKEAERLHGHNTAKMQETYGPPIARAILEEIGLPEPQIAEVCAIIATHHTPSGIPGPNFPILWDADMIVNLGDSHLDPAGLPDVIEKSFKTQTGKAFARMVLLPGTE